MENTPEDDDLPTAQRVAESVAPKLKESIEALEQISYCLGVAKRLVDIELGRIPR